MKVSNCLIAIFLAFIFTISSCSTERNCAKLPTSFGYLKKAINTINNTSWNEEYINRPNGEVFEIHFKYCNNQKSFLLVYTYDDIGYNYCNYNSIRGGDEYFYISYFQNVPKSIYDSFISAADKSLFIDNSLVPNYPLKLKSIPNWLSFTLWSKCYFSFLVVVIIILAVDIKMKGSETIDESKSFIGCFLGISLIGWIVLGFINGVLLSITGFAPI
jgi:hypothetical protein